MYDLKGDRVLFGVAQRAVRPRREKTPKREKNKRLQSTTNSRIKVDFDPTRE